MANHIKFESRKSYATEANAVKAAQDKFGDRPELRFFTTQIEGGRWIPVFVGEVALRHGVHFHFHVVN